MLYNTELALMILKAFGLNEKEGLSFQVMEKPVEFNDVNYWKLIPQEDL